tara:strand:- start:99 stop:716 length:618 start_codon:yes stop_codon:yes gene_type:complete
MGFLTIEPKLSNLFKLLSLLSPILLVFFMVMLSLFNQDIKGLVYLAGILVSSTVNIVAQHIIRSRPNEKASIVCGVFTPSLLDSYNSPNSSSLLIAFTIAYLFLPMRFNNNMNYLVLIALFSLFGIDAYTKVTSLCTPSTGAFLGALLGFVLGSLWFTLFHMTGNDSLLYFDTYSSNRVFCEKPSKQTFKCKVYKNGQLISSNIA